jgi:hypothetical protein
MERRKEGREELRNLVARALVVQEGVAQKNK